MSGVEVAGLVLGAIPLILAGLKFYGEGISVTKRYLKYQREVDIMVYELSAEHTMYINSINILLIGVVSPKDIPEFLKEPAGNRWKEQRFDDNLQKRLGNSYASYMESITQMARIAERFKEKLKLDKNGQPQFNQVSAFKEHYKRLRFSLKKTDYEELMEKLRRANQSLYRMTTQTAYIESQQAKVKPKRQNVPNFKVIKRKAENFHSAIKAGWKCPCHLNHGVNLRLEDRMEEPSSDRDYSSDEDEEVMRDPFHVLFCYNHQHTKQVCTAATDPWTWQEADVRIENIPETQSGQPAQPAAPKGVRFTKQKMAKAVHAALEPQQNLQPIQDLCSAISTLNKPQRDVCFSLLAHEIAIQKYGVHIYPAKQFPPDIDTWSISSLRTILASSDFARQDRLKLAVTLASSCLQLHETPWLHDDWGKDNTFFICQPSKILYDQPFVSHRVDPTFSVAGMPPSMSRIIRNQTLYALGVALIELWYGKSLSEMHKLTDGPYNTGNEHIDFMTEWAIADRVVEELYSEAGGKYSDAVRRCIRCDFGRRANSLEDAQFQRAVYQGVVAELKANYEFMFQRGTA